MKNTQKQNSNEKRNSFYVLLKISKKPQNQFEIIQEALKKDGTNCEEGKRMNQKGIWRRKKKLLKRRKIGNDRKRINFFNKN